MGTQHPTPGLVMNNPKAYSLPKGTRFVLRIEAKTDGVPGMWDTPADLMQWLCTHPYIQSVKLLEVGEQQHNTKKQKTLPTKAKERERKTGE